MAILTDEIKIARIGKLSSSYIEAKIVELGFLPLRWAIVNVDENFLTVSVSYQKNS